MNSNHTVMVLPEMKADLKKHVKEPTEKNT